MRRLLGRWVYPRLAAAREAFQAALGRLGLRGHPRVRLSPRRPLKGPDFHLEIKFRDAPELQELLQEIARHVMAHESFENEGVAAILNEHFVSIKVDREERPDLDETYMNVVTALTGRGGWPMSVFLTPDLKPYYGGTYFPPTDRGGLPGFPRLLLARSQAYRQNQEQIEELSHRVSGPFCRK